MERVQFQQEQMLAELKDLVQKGLFTQKEIKQVMKKRTAFETALVRRIAKKNDYLRYAAYEMGLEALRKKRVERLKLPRSTPSVSDYALVRRQFHIFERALKKFKSDVALWIQYIQVAKKEGARSLVGRITARALQLHPNVPSLYILAAQHELSHLSPSAARTLLQRGIRLNGDNVEMWREYVRMEMGFVEGMRRRWGVLGIDLNGKGKAKAQENVEDGMDDTEVEQMQGEAEGEGDEAEKARREIMQGAIVKSVISNAVKALPKAELFTSLHGLLTTYPVPPPFRVALLDHLHTLLQQTLPTDPVAVRLTATRLLVPDLTGEALVDALRDANEKMSRAVRQACDGKEVDVNGLASAYSLFVKEWVQKDELDDSIKAYLLTSMHVLIQHLSKSSPPMVPAPILEIHLSLLTTNPKLRTSLPYAKNISDIARRYTSLQRTDAGLWIARLEAEQAFSTASSVGEGMSVEMHKNWEAARSVVSGDDVVRVWTWGVTPVEDINDEAEAKNALHLLGELLAETLRMQDTPSFRAVHDHLLKNCASLLKYLSSPQDRTTYYRRLSSAYLPDASTFKAFFRTESSLPAGEESEPLLQEIFQTWRRRDIVEASLAWAGWLLVKGRGKEASEVIQRARTEVGAVQGPEQKQRLEAGWVAVMGELEKGGAKEAESDEEMHDA